MTAPVGYFTVYHGKLEINVPFDIFILHTTELDPVKSKRFGETLKSRYPWLTDDAIKVIMNNSVREMKRLNEERKRDKGVVSMDPVKDMKSEIAKTKAALEKDPNDAMAWMKLGELLCKNGDTEEGYKALNKGRSLLK